MREDWVMPLVDEDLHTILAKSDPPESLVTHTWWVLSRLADQRLLRPSLADETDCPRLWHWLYWGTFLHDFGKAAEGFQTVLKHRTGRWEFRHEALSLAFVDWLFPDKHPDRVPVIAVIACHHRDVEVITHKYTRNRFDAEEDSATKLLRQVREADWQRLYRWLTEYGWSWAEVLGFAPDIELPDFPTLELAQERLKPQAIHRAVGELAQYTGSLRFASNASLALIGTLLRGLILTADHAGSAHSAPFSPAPLEHAAVLNRLGVTNLFPHQEEAAATSVGSSLLISPTSSGKTEAALLWLAQQQVHDRRPAPRIFYLLPYQASMNALHKRLKPYFKEEVGLQHGRMTQVLFEKALTEQQDSETAAAYARQQSALAQLLHFPVTVMSPYQLLKIPYQLKGFEALLAHFYGGHFILDEIHAYEPKRLALIIAVLQFLHEHCQARFFIMTATLPPQVRVALQNALPGLQRIEAAPETFQRFQRHRVHLLPHDLLAPETLARIVDDADHKSILICCNTVRRAMEVYTVVGETLRKRYPDEDFCIILLHSRFNNQDRTHKEQQIIERTGVNGQRHQRTIVVATQVVEVSLNIDLDTLYTEAAPLEALLQRFGRVNRGRPPGSPLADVYVLREQPDSVKYVYDLPLIEAALDCLEKANGTAIDESQVSRWLEQIYVGEALTRWQQQYEESWRLFQEEVMSALRPFTASDLDTLFFQMFDGIDVLPSIHLNIYGQHIREGKYLEAARWLVPMTWRDYKCLEKHQKAWHEKQGRGDLYVVSVPYDSETGLDLYSVYQAEGSQFPKTPLDDFDVPMEAD